GLWASFLWFMSRRCARRASSLPPPSARCCSASRSGGGASSRPHWSPAATRCCTSPAEARSVVAEFARRVAAGVELAALHGLAIVAKRPAHRREGEVGPRDLLPAEEADLGALGAGRDVGRGEAGAVDHLHLREPRDGVDG